MLLLVKIINKHLCSNLRCTITQSKMSDMLSTKCKPQTNKTKKCKRQKKPNNINGYNLRQITNKKLQAI